METTKNFNEIAKTLEIDKLIVIKKANEQAWTAQETQKFIEMCQHYKDKLSVKAL